MAGFGEQLRAEREQRGLSLEELCARTKVQQRHLQALEHEDYRELPGGVFRKGIVRAYLAATGLEEETWLPRFQQSFDDQARARGEAVDADPEAWAAFAENVRRNRTPVGQRNGARWIGVLLLFLLLAGGGYALWHFYLRFHFQF